MSAETVSRRVNVFFYGLFMDETLLRASLGEPTIARLGDSSIRHEWTVKAGKRILNRLLTQFGPQFKKVICGKDGLYKSPSTDKSDEMELAFEVGERALALAGFATGKIWYPVAAYVGVLLVKRGLKLYCEPARK